MKELLKKPLRAVGISIALSTVMAVPALAETLRVTVAYYSDATEPYFRAQAEQFAKAHPGTDVEIEVVNWDSLQQKLTTDIASGNAPDLALIGTRWIVEFADAGLLEPLGNYGGEAFKSRFIGAFLSPGEIDGTLYGLPIAASARAMYYNKTLFEEAGVTSVPQTWDDVEKAADRIADTGNYGFGLQGKEIDTDVYFYLPFWTNGGELLNDAGEPDFDSPAGIKTATIYQTLIQDNLTQPGVTGYNREDVQNLFKQGRLGMVLSLPFLANQIKDEAPDLDYGIAAIPNGGTPATYAVTDSMVMFADSDVKDEAWAFLDQIFQPEARIEFTKAEGFLPTPVGEAADPYFQNNADLKAFVDLLPTAKFAPLIANWEGFSTSVIRALQSLYLGELTPEEAMKQADADATVAMQ